MTENYIIKISDKSATLESVGGKGVSLSRLINQGLPVPDGFHVTTDAYRRFTSQNDLQKKILNALEEVNESKPSTMEQVSQKIRNLFDQAIIPAEVAEAISYAYKNMLNGDQPVAVRSSATAEDQPDFSFAGQQESFLNVIGSDDLLEAVKKCWASLWTARAIGYRIKNKVAPESLAMAVVVQKLVDADASGILFTANPITGIQEEVYINAGWGLGEAVVGGLVTPDTLIMDKKSGEITQRDTSHKETMSARSVRGTEERPVPQELRSIPVLDDSKARELFQMSLEIEKIYNQPMDIEWAIANGQIAILQARPITSLPEASAPTQIDWKLPDPDGQYLRTSVVDFMPSPLSPLFRTLGLSSLDPALHSLIEWIGKSEVEGMLENLFVTINGYAYFRAKYSRREWTWMLVRMLPNFPRMLREGITYWREVTRPEYLHTTRKWKTKSLDQLSPNDLLTGVDEIQRAAFKLLGSLMAGTLGAAAGSEGLFTNIYNKYIKREGDPDATAFLMGYDSTPIQAEKSLFDLARWISQQEDIMTLMLEVSAQDLEKQIKQEHVPDGVSPENWRAFKDRLGSHFDGFGHIIYDLDYSQPLPVDDPSPMINTMKMYLRNEGKNPYDRQRKLEEQRIQSVRETRDRLRGVRLWTFNKSLSWAQRQAEVREDSIADIGLGYPQLRVMLLELGSRIAEAGGIQEAEQIFWLEKSEVEDMIAALERNQPLENRLNVIEERIYEWNLANQVTPPPMLPPRDKYLGFDADTWFAASEEDQVGNTLKGVPASSGSVSGRARVLHDPDEFDLMRPGDILVAEITTPAWTPLFAMASGVVTDIGGPLSHGSIVAREYGIPAVLGTGIATKRIRSGQTITVDGSAGTVELLNEN